MEPKSKKNPTLSCSLVFFSVFFSSLLSTSSSNQFERYNDGFAIQHLQRYGYLDSVDQIEQDYNDDELKSSIRTYQQNFHLNTTGVFDSETLAMMMAPRCGCPDIINGTNTMERRRSHATNPNSSFDSSKFTFFQNNNPPRKWEKGVLTVIINKDTFTPDEATWVEQGLVEWHNKTKFEFIVLSIDSGSDQPDDDIRMEKFRGDHADGAPFDGPGGELAHAAGPNDGRVHFDGDETWVKVSGPNDGRVHFSKKILFDLPSVSVHELGHVLGLGHSKVFGSVMNPHIHSGEVKREPQKDDLDGIEALYPGMVR